MTRKTKIALAAALIAAFATPALARDGHSRHHSRYEQSYSQPAPRFIEGRNAGVYGNFGGAYGGTSTGRDALVQTLGN
jgi:hypothetical protein